ncbi:MAG: hypothetical protein ACE5EQ_05295 [Phycisphaerae bacterium]
MPADSNIWQRLVELGERAGADTWAGIIAAVALGLATALSVLALFISNRGWTQRVRDLEDRLAEHITRMHGPSVRAYCRRLISSVNLRIPQPNKRRSHAESEDDLIAGLEILVRACRHRDSGLNRDKTTHASQITRLESLLQEARDISTNVDELKSLCDRGESILRGIDERAGRMSSEQERANTLLGRLDGVLERIGTVEAARESLSHVREAAEETRQALETMNGSLNGQLEQRRDLVHRIDRQLRERQIQLVTDILRAEGRHLELTTALSKVQETVSSIQELMPMKTSKRRNVEITTTQTK